MKFNSNPNTYRDFSYDIVNCGADTDAVNIYSGDGEIASNYESVTDNDN